MNFSLLKILGAEKIMSAPDPSESPNYYRVKRILQNQAFIRWHDEVGRHAIEQMEASLASKILRAINHPRLKEEDRNANLMLLDDIQRDAAFIDRITSAFEEEDKRASKEIPGKEQNAPGK